MKTTDFLVKGIFVLLSMVLMLTACDSDKETPILPEEEGPAQENDIDVGTIATLNIDDVGVTTATFTISLKAEGDDLPEQIVVYYVNYENQDFPDTGMSYVCEYPIAFFEKTGSVTSTITDLEPNTKHYYRMSLVYDSKQTHGDIKDFTTLPDPYKEEMNMDVSSGKDLSTSATANCYMVSESGTYKFKATKGNSSESVGDVAKCVLLWESVWEGEGSTLDRTRPGELIKGVCYDNGYIAFNISDIEHGGNAVIAVKDKSDKILWSWHIWVTDRPQEHTYPNGAGILMDRNLGATSAVPGDPKAAGLLYQWGRKDPFLGEYDRMTVSISWPGGMNSSSNGTIEYATANPTTFLLGNKANNDWLYTGDSSYDITRWLPSDKPKTIYDPCPAGWRVPDGGENGVWAKSGYSTTGGYEYDTKGRTFNIASPATTWYPAAGYLRSYYGTLDKEGTVGCYWSASQDKYSAYYFHISGGNSFLVFDIHNSLGHSVRCAKE
ncbi:MAG: hypothetical protein IKB85_02690 [Bacteroidales bacterium]|nr:hypothetical protein [Bacteroidales bacterium]